MENGCISNIGFLSFRVIFHFHDYGRKGSSGREQNPDVSKVFVPSKKKRPQKPRRGGNWVSKSLWCLDQVNGDGGVSGS